MIKKINYNEYIRSEKMLALFSREADGYIELFTTSLNKLKEDITYIEMIQDVNRAVHTIKSMSGTLEYKNLMNVAGELENIIIGVCDGTVEINDELIDGLLEYSDILKSLKEEALSGKEPATDIEPIISEIKALVNRH